MTQTQLLDELSRYTPLNKNENETKAQFTQLLLNQPRCFERSCFDPGHITASSWILHPDQNQVLLTHHRKLNIWIQLGGHSDGDPDSLQVAIREAVEESGISDIRPMHSTIFDLDVHSIPQNKKEPSHRHYDVRYLLQAHSERYTISNESIDLKWIPLNQLEIYTQEESVLRMREKWLNRNF